MRRIALIVIVAIVGFAGLAFWQVGHRRPAQQKDGSSALVESPTSASHVSDAKTGVCGIPSTLGSDDQNQQEAASLDVAAIASIAKTAAEAGAVALEGDERAMHVIEYTLQIKAAQFAQASAMSKWPDYEDVREQLLQELSG
ncbi:MAG TPA: hypothetical protein VMZ31_10705 [Phycisphaerae bacterium]|nr:hypothetical protein [Phycisphaerae bacterium]